MIYKKVLYIAIVILFMQSCKFNNSNANREEVELKIFNNELPRQSSIYLKLFFNLNYDSLKHQTNELVEIHSELNRIIYQKDRKHVTNDYYLWGKFVSRRNNNLITKGNKAINIEDKSFFWNYYLELVPDSIKITLENIDINGIECFYSYQNPYRDSSIPLLNFIFFDKNYRAYYYAECVGRYVKKGTYHNGLEINLFNSTKFESFVREKNITYWGKARRFPFVGDFSYVVLENTKADLILNTRFDSDDIEKTRIITNQNEINKIFNWLGYVDSTKFASDYLKSVEVDEIYYRYKDFSGAEFQGAYNILWVAYNKTKNHSILVEIDYFDYTGENHSKYIYNPLESEFEAKDK